MSNSAASNVSRPIARFTQEHLLLLQVCLSDEATAKAAWGAWSATVDLDTIDSLSYQLLPLLYRRLEIWRLTGPNLGRLAGVYRNTWARNQLVFPRLGNLLEQLVRSGIVAVVLNDVALALRYYPDSGVRPINEIVLLVKVAETRQAVSLLIQAGWQSHQALTDRRLAFVPGQQFYDQQGQLLQLRWRAFSAAYQEEVDTAFRERTVDLAIANLSANTLDPTAQLLLRLCDERSRTTFWWLADAAAIITRFPNEINWVWLVAQARRCHVNQRLSFRLADLVSLLHVTVPEEVRRDLAAIPVSQLERLEARHGKTDSGFYGHWLRFSRTNNLTNSLQKQVAFANYLQAWWELDRRWHMPLYLARKVLR